jgi:gamma-glutamyltranspeptidase/glutathione hydrolase
MRHNLLSFPLVLALLVCSIAVFGASPKPAWAPHAMVSSAESLATEVGLQVLRRGGNAVDAAAAVALALNVTESYSSGIGGGCFIVIHMADGREVAIDGRETAPARSTRLMYVPRDTTTESFLSTTGVLAAGTPGELAALELAVRQYGRLSLAEALEGPVALADTGFVLSMRYARALGRERDKLALFPGTKSIFFKNDSLPLAFGERLVQTDLAHTFRRVQSDGIQAFYQGELPAMVEKYMRANGGILYAADFASYQPIAREPVHGSYHGYEVISMPPPSSGGIHVIQILNILEPFNLRYLGLGSSESFHLIAEAMAIAFADRAEFLGDPAFTRVPTAGLVSKEYADDRRVLIDRMHHKKLDQPGNPFAFGTDPTADPDGKHTTHLCVVDSFGNAVSLTATINTPFGSGVIVPGTGFFLNNEMDDFVTWPGHPNFFGLVGKEANEIEPSKRPLSSMSPTIILKDERPIMVVGSMGGPRIITSVVLTVLNAMDYGLQLQAAMDFPRIHEQWVPDELFVESDISDDVKAALRSRGHHVTVQDPWAAVTAILADSAFGGWWGAADGRVTGLAKGF